MRKSKSLQRLRDGNIAYTACLGHYIPAFVHQAALNAYDCIWLDLEHRDMSTSQVQALLAYSHLHDIDILVRPPTREKIALYRYLEEGAAGLLIPHVSTAEEAKSLVQATKFPPLGDRGSDNAGFDADYNMHETDTYIEWANRETFLAVQIETLQAVQNIDAIVAVDGIDLIFIGPGDLGMRLGQTNEMSLDEAFQRVQVACSKAGIPWGCPALNAEIFKTRRNQGAQFLVASGDFLGCRNELESKMAAVKGIQ